jgi:hypothetical protein
VKWTAKKERDKDRKNGGEKNKTVKRRN